MFCYRCGSSMPDNATACPLCGAAVQQPSQPTAQPASPTPTPPVSQPVSYQPGVVPGQPGQPQYYGQPQESSGQATASMILGILSIACFGILAGIPAVILGHLAKSNIRKSGGRLTGDGKATTGLVLGYVSIAFLPLMFAILIPSLLRSRIAANESAAASTLRTINTTQITYQTQYPAAGYARDLATLGPGPSGTCLGEGTQQHACLLDGRIANSSCTGAHWCAKSGYEYSISAVCDAQNCTDYVVAARAVTPGSTGDRSFCSTTDAVIRVRRGTITSMPTVDECRSWNPIY